MGRLRHERKMDRMQEKMDRVRAKMDRARGGNWWGGAAVERQPRLRRLSHRDARRLEEEQREFSEFLERLRFAKDRTEFDQFMAERRNRAAEPTARSRRLTQIPLTAASRPPTGERPAVPLRWSTAGRRPALRTSAAPAALTPH